MSNQFWYAFSSLILIAQLFSACQPTTTVTETSITALLPASTTGTAVSQPSSTKTLATSTFAALPTLLPPPTSVSTPAPAPMGEPLWTFPTQGEVWSSPTVLDGVVYFGSDDHFLYAVDLATHRPRWRFETGDLVRSRPALADGRVYFTSDDNYLYALDAQTGEEVWRFNLGEALAARAPIESGWDYPISSPAVAEGVVYVGSANMIFYAVDASTGQEKWRFQVMMGPVRSSPTVMAGVVYIGDWFGVVYALEAQTGQMKWSFNTGATVISSPTMADGIIYIGDRMSQSSQPFLYALDAKTGKQKWRFSFNGSWVDSSATVVNGTVYIGSSDWKRLSAIDAVTGQLKWYFAGTGYMWCTPAVAKGVVYIGETDEFFYAIDAGSGQEQWRVQVGKALKTVALPVHAFHGGVVSSPTVVDGVVYFGGLDGKLYAVSTVP
jgi:outer membrane protein assembly factor BamB